MKHVAHKSFELARLMKLNRGLKALLHGWGDNGANATGLVSRWGPGLVDFLTTQEAVYVSWRYFFFCNVGAIILSLHSLQSNTNVIQIFLFVFLTSFIILQGWRGG